MDDPKCRGRVQCSEDRAVARALREGAGEHERVQHVVQPVIRTTIEIAFPARDRHETFESSGVRDPRDLHELFDGGHLHFGRQGRDSEDVGVERDDLELVGVVERVRLARDIHPGRSFLHRPSIA